MLVSDGKYIAVLDDDDYWTPTNLRERVQVMEADPECPVCYTDCWRVNDKDKWRYWDCSKGNPFPNILSPAALLRGDIFRKLGGWDPWLDYYHAELDYYLRLDYKNFIHIPKPLAVTTMGSNQMSTNRLKEAEQLDYIVTKHIDTLKTDRKKLAYYYIRIGLHIVEGKSNGRSYFKKALELYPRAYEAWGGLLLPRFFLLSLYRIYRRIKSYDSKVYENPFS
jgi:glycosyltransferase involved in cell wall biosynthesis